MGFYFTEMQKKANGGTEQCCRMIESRLNPELLNHFQIIPSRVTELLQDKIRIYYIHDLPSDPETNHLIHKESRDRFHKFVFVGHWQYNQYIDKLNIPQDEKCIVIEPPIEPIPWKPKEKDKIRLIYTSTPQRGLEILVPVFVELAKKHSNIHLDVFSSFELYGWKNADDRFKEVFDICKNHPQITYHGAQPIEVVREYLQKAHIFAYPSIWLECNSRALIEAMSAGCLCLHPNLAGLSDTSGNLTAIYQFIADHNKHAGKFYNLLNHAFEVIHKKETELYLNFVKQYADIRFNVNKIVSQWHDLLEGLLQKYSSIESRKIETNRVFYYNSSKR